MLGGHAQTSDCRYNSASTVHNLGWILSSSVSCSRPLIPAGLPRPERPERPPASRHEDVTPAVHNGHSAMPLIMIAAIIADAIIVLSIVIWVSHSD